MTDETYERVAAHVKQWAILPCPLFANGLGIDLVIDPTVPVDEPVLGWKGYANPIRLHPDDFRDLKLRLNEGPPDDLGA